MRLARVQLGNVKYFGLKNLFENSSSSMSARTSRMASNFCYFLLQDGIKKAKEKAAEGAFVVKEFPVS